MDYEDEVYTQLKPLLMQLIKSLGHSDKFTGEVVTFLRTTDGMYDMAQFLVDNQEASEQEILNELVVIVKRDLNIP